MQCAEKSGTAFQTRRCLASTSGESTCLDIVTNNAATKVVKTAGKADKTSAAAISSARNRAAAANKNATKKRNAAAINRSV